MDTALLTKTVKSLSDNDMFIACVLRIVDGKGYLGYMYFDNYNEVDISDVPVKKVQEWAEFQCELNHAVLYSY